MPAFGARQKSPATRIEVTEMLEARDEAPINPEWIIAGNPKAHVSTVSKSEDTFATTFVWSCTAGSFHWHFASDETVHILEGEVFVTDDAGEERHLGPGAMALFRAGSHSIWHVPHYVKKIAFLYEAPPVVVSLGLRALRKLKTLMGIRKTGLAA